MIAAVVVTHNRLAALQRTVARLREEPLDLIVIVDNGSDDGTADWLAGQADPRLHVLRPGVNLGGAGGFEAGMRAAVEGFDPDWIVVMDDDARPQPGCVARFRALDHGTWDAHAAAVYDPEGAIAEMNRPTFNPFWNVGRVLFRRGDFHVTDADYQGGDPVPIDVASFVGLFLSRGAVAKVGYPDPDLFIYGDDVLYTLALRRSRLRTCFDPRLRFDHDCGGSNSGTVLCRPLWKVYFLVRNNVFICRAAAGPVLFPIALLFYVSVWLRRGLGYPPEERPTYYRIMRRALRDGLRGRRGTKHAEVVGMAARTATPGVAAVAKD